MKLLVRADDAGLFEDVLPGMELSVRQGLARNIGVMTNTPARYIAEYGIEAIRYSQL